MNWPLIFNNTGTYVGKLVLGSINDEVDLVSFTD